MLDIKFIRDNADVVKQAMQAKGFDAALIDEIVPIEAESRQLLGELEALRSERNKIAALGPHAAEQGRKIKAQIEELNFRVTNIQANLQALVLQVPNLVSVDTPIGEGESANTVIRTVGEVPAIANPVDHVVLAERYDLIDQERGTKVAGSRFHYLKNQAVLLEMALVQLGLSIAQKHGFSPMITPELVNEKTVMGTGYLPYGQDEVYKTQDDLYLIGTSELPLVAYHQDEMLAASQLPLRYVGYSACFRREAGSYGRDTRGIIRQHQFGKVELVSLTEPQCSAEEHEKILAIEEEIMQTLGLPYQVVQIGSGDLGVQAFKKYDINTWMPGQNKYRETHSTSNTTDFQSRRLNIRYKTAEGKNEFVHTLNGTAIAMERMIVAILENGQRPDGTIQIPRALETYTGFAAIT